jgi:hypothetical protein
MPIIGIHGDTPLNINLNINNENQYYKTGTVCSEVLVGGGKMNEGDYEIKQRNLLQLL